MTARLLPVLLTVLAGLSLTGACVLQGVGQDASQAWTAFLGFSGALLGVHIPAPATLPAPATVPVGDAAGPSVSFPPGPAAALTPADG